MEITIGKLLSLVTALAYAIAAILVTREIGAGFGVAVVLLFPLSLIWLPDFWGERIAGRITKETPAVVVALGGWLLLVGLPLVLYWTSRQ
jgi:hypothetical protein